MPANNAEKTLLRSHRLMNRRLVLLISLGLGLLTAALYWPATAYDFIAFDDGVYVTGNEQVHHGLTLEGARWAFTTMRGSNWHPLTWLSHMLDVSLFGMVPGAHHFTSVLFHVTNTVLLFLLLARITGRLWPAAVVAALFGWHPLHVESVAWVAERKDVLSTFFMLLALMAYVRYREKPSPGPYTWVVIFFTLGLLAKPMLVTLPCLLLVLDYWPLGRLRLADVTARAFLGEFPTLIREKLPLFALAAASCLVTILAQSRGGAVQSLETIPFGARCANALVSYGAYLWKMIWPLNLAVYYPLEPARPLVAVAWAVVLIAGSIWVWRSRVKQPWLLAGWLWYAVTLVPVIGLVQVGGQAMADRYTYISLIGLFWAAVWTTSAWLEDRQASRLVVASASAALLVFCAAAMARQLSFWRDGITLFERSLRVAGNNEKIQNNLGVELRQRGRIEEALAHYAEALRLNPKCTRARANLALNHYNLGCEWAGSNQWARALAHFQDALRLTPDDPAIANNLGATLVQECRFSEALPHFRTALRHSPNYARAHLNLAAALAKEDRPADALAEFREAVRLMPDSPEALGGLAWFLATCPDPEFRDPAEAVRLAEHANDLTKPPQAAPLDTLAAAYAATGRFQEALQTVEKARRCAERAGDMTLLEQVQTRARFYAEGKPFLDLGMASGESR